MIQSLIRGDLNPNIKSHIRKKRRRRTRRKKKTKRKKIKRRKKRNTEESLYLLQVIVLKLQMIGNLMTVRLNMEVQKGFQVAQKLGKVIPKSYMLRITRIIH